MNTEQANLFAQDAVCETCQGCGMVAVLRLDYFVSYICSSCKGLGRKPEALRKYLDAVYGEKK